MPSYLKEINVLLGRDIRFVPLIFIFFILSAVIELAGIGLMVPYITFVAEADGSKGGIYFVGELFESLTGLEMTVVTMSFLLVTIFIVKAVFGIWVSYFIAKFSMKQQANLRSRLMQEYQSMPYANYLNYNSADFIYTIQTLVSKFSENVLFFGLKAASDGLIAISIAILLMLVDMTAFIVMVSILGIFGLLYDRIFREKAIQYGAKANQSASNIMKGVSEGSDGFKEIRMLGREEYFHNTVSNNSIKFGIFNTRSTVISMAPRYILEVILVMLLVFLVLWTVEFHHGTDNNFSMVVLFSVAALRLAPATNGMISAVVHLRVGRNAVSRLYNYFSKQGVYNNKPLIEKIDQKPFHSVELKGVSYLYSNAKYNALSNIDLTIKSGESVGFIGASGSGKTTLIDVLLGLLPPSQGVILLNNSPIVSDGKEWKHNVAYMPQQLFLIDDTLRANIALGECRGNINEKKIEFAIKKAHLNELVQQLPEGLDTALGEHGIRLSGGQRQRVSLARAFYNERSVLVMDEATSALDTETEYEVIEEIKRLKGKVTMLVIAHRFATVEHCDRIYKLEKGRIVAVGSPDEIIKG